MKYVFGYTNFIDGSARGVVPPTNVFYQMKSRDTFAPIGPYIVTADEIKDANKLQVRLTNNGTVMQNFNTDDMAHKIPRCIEWVTSIHTLVPGDILATGTNHRGLNPFMDGDKIELTCEGFGTLHIKVKDQHKRTWARITRLKHKESGARACTRRRPAANTRRNRADKRSVTATRLPEVGVCPLPLRERATQDFQQTRRVRGRGPTPHPFLPLKRRVALSRKGRGQNPRAPNYDNVRPTASGPEPLRVLGQRHDAAGERQHADRPQQQREISVIVHGTGEAIAVPSR